MGSTREVIWIQQESPCPYTPGKLQRLFALRSTIQGEDRQDLYKEFLPKGFQTRSVFVTGNDCKSCNACIPLRIDLENYTLTKKEKALFIRNADLQVSHTRKNSIVYVNQEHITLFRKHSVLQHNNMDAWHMPESDIRNNLDGHSGLMEIRSDRGELIAAAIYDDLGDALNGHYYFYDRNKSTNRTSLGTYTILKLMEHAVAQGIKHLYLGVWVAENTKLAYKTQFRNLEALTPQGWVPFDPVIHTTGPDYKAAIPPELLKIKKGP